MENGGEALPVGRLAFKAREGRQTVLSGFDSHSLPPKFRSGAYSGSGGFVASAPWLPWRLRILISLETVFLMSRRLSQTILVEFAENLIDHGLQPLLPWPDDRTVFLCFAIVLCLGVISKEPWAQGYAFCVGD